MPINPGTKLGAYEVTAPIGAGGMGEVYRARDTKLERDVAIKVLPEELAKDKERVARFEREAKLLASLNHPNIASIYGFESGALVLELVEGPTLAEKIQEGPIPIDEAIAIARQIAEALEAGHEAGVIHRDLKPANIKLKEDGTVKVLDYGLAKALEGDLPSNADADLSQSPTLARQGTQIGVILGTAAYMSPEQAKGKRLDKRTDVWSYGTVVLEMLTGKRAFAGEDVSDTLAAVLRAEPDFGALPADLSPTLRKYLASCLEKDPKRRVQAIGDVRLALEGVFDVPVAPPDSRSVSDSARAGYIGTAAVTGAALLVGLLIGRAWFHTPFSVPAGQLTRFTLDLDEGQHLSGAFSMEEEPRGLQRPSRRSFALSPDGRDLVYVTLDGYTTQLFRRSMDQEKATPIPDSEGASFPFFAPDGGAVAFIVGTELKRVSLASSEVRTITTSGPGFDVRRGASWTVNDTILLASTDGIYELPANGGSLSRVMADSTQGGRLAFPQLLPGGRAVLFNEVGSYLPSEWNIAVESLDTGQRHVVVEGGSDPRYLPSGHLLFIRTGTLMAVPFDVNRLEVDGTPIVVVEDVMHAELGTSTALDTGMGQFSVSRSGTLAYVPGGIYPVDVSAMVWVDRTGAFEPLPLPLGNYYNPRFSPDGNRVAFVEVVRGDVQIWVYDIELQTPVRLTTTGTYFSPVWSSDGRRLAFGSVTESGNQQLFSMAADGSGEPQPLIKGDAIQRPSSWSRDGVLAFVQNRGQGHRDIWTVSTDENGIPEPFLETPFDEAWPAFSPDGRWLAYASNETGRYEVYVRPFPDGAPAHRVSTAGGGAPLWSRDGRQLFYRKSGEDRNTGIMVVDVETDAAFTRSQPRALFESQEFRGSIPTRSYDVAPDGRRFVMSTNGSAEPQPVTGIHVVLNWLEELERLVPTDK